MQKFRMDYWSRKGAKIRSTANDIKRNAQALAEEIEESLATVHAVFEGAAPPEVYERVVNKMVTIYPLSALDLDVRQDDTDEGVVIQTPDKARASSRIFDRANRSGQPTPYYEYRDAAMSSVGPYRPEWIKELRIVGTSDATDPDVSYNSGHLMHQATFFVGPVNFYWKVEGEAYVEQMDTGDSNYITPFVPHSFASRDPSKDAYIVAVTFCGKLDAIQQEVMMLDPKGVEEELFDLSDRHRAFSGILRRELAISMLNLEHLSVRTGLSVSRLGEFLGGREFPEAKDMVSLSDALGTNLRDLLPPEVSDPREVVVRHTSPDLAWTFPSYELPRYQVENLAGSRKVPFLKGMAVNVLESALGTTDPDLDISVPSHEFCYNFGNVPVILNWQGEKEVRNAVVEPGGSYYMKPTVRHALRSTSRSNIPQVVLMRVGASLYGDAHLELSSYPKETLHRVFRESQQWYDPNKIGG